MSRLLVVVLALVLAGCTVAPSPTPRAEASPSPAAPAATPTPGAFPVTISHRYGRTEISQAPLRIVTVGLTDHDAFLALGVAPVGVTDWYGGHPHATWPWAVDELGEGEPEVIGTATELNFERIVALQPGLIVGLYSAMTEDEYRTLSAIAPTVAPPAEYGDWQIPWQELTLTAGRVLGRPAEAEGLVEGVEARFAAVRERLPEFAAATAAIAVPYEGIYVYSFEVAIGRLLASLGFALPGDLATLIGDADGTPLSLERIDLLDTDVLIWLDAAPEQEPLTNPLYERLAVHREGREVLISSSSTLGGAMLFSSVLSLPHVLDELVPQLEAAIDGDPATVVQVDAP